MFTQNEQHTATGNNGAFELNDLKCAGDICLRNTANMNPY